MTMPDAYAHLLSQLGDSMQAANLETVEQAIDYVHAQSRAMLETGWLTTDVDAFPADTTPEGWKQA